MSHRPTVYGTRHAVSAGHYLAASAAFSILEAGGNAIDAGCAAGIALAVLQPDLVNVAGVAPIMIRLADGTVESIAGLGWWPKSLPADLFMREHGGKIPDGVLRTVIPAAPDAWITALERHGTMRFADVAASAIRYAGEGFAVYPLLAVSIAAHEHEYRRWQSNTAIFLPHDRVPRSGEKFVQSDLARTLQFMADQDRAAGPDRNAGLRAAHDAFYRGDIAREIAAFQKREGGYLTMQDLAEYRSAIEPVVRRAWRGHEVITCGPWCQGPALLEALALLERVGIAGLPHNSAIYLHRIAECVNLAMADREYFFGDPAFVDVPIDHLLDPATVARRASAVRDDRAFGEMPAPLDRTNLPHMASAAEMPKVEADTSYCCVVDRWGNAFSATPSDGSGNLPVVPGLGITPSGRGSQSRPDPRHPGGRRARQAPAADAQPGDGGDRQGRRDAVRHAGRRRADPGHASGAAERLPARHGTAGRDRGAARCQLFLPVIFRAVRVFPGTAGGRGPDRCGNPRRSRLARSRGAELAGLDLARRFRRGNPHRPCDWPHRCRRRSATARLRDRDMIGGRRWDVA